MNNTKTTKRALLSSVMAMLICVAMLIGTTFAWFTDSASTAVSKIQAGTLKIELLDAAGQSVEGRALNWKTADSRAQAAILWEPGCTYELETVTVKNAGNLALKYKVVISGINGSAKLNEVIDWTINGADVGTEYSLGVDESKTLTIKGHMQESAGNDYQGLSIDGIGITVYATQDTVEADSNNDQYDAAAEYQSHVVIPALNNAKLNKVGNTYKYADDNVVATVPETAVTGTPTVTVTPTEVPATIIVNLGEKKAVSYDISISNVTLTANDPATVSFNVGAGLDNLVIYHNDTAMTKDTDGVLVDGEYSYDYGTGYVTIKTSTFSPFTVVYESDAIEVSTAEELSEVLNKEYTESATILLTNDIDLSGIEEWGKHDLRFGKNVALIINGAGRTISGLKSATSYDALGFTANGLITSIDGDHHAAGTLKVQNLTVDGAELSTSGEWNSVSAVMVGTTGYTNTSFENCHITRANISNSAYAAGFIGYTQGNTDITSDEYSCVTIQNCSVSSSAISASGHAGALVSGTYTPVFIASTTVTGNTLTNESGYSSAALVAASWGGTKATNVTASGNNFGDEPAKFNNYPNLTCYDETYGYIFHSSPSYTINGTEYNK